MKPMTQEDALRIIRNVAEHNTHDVSMPSELVAIEANRVKTEKELLYEATELVDEAVAVLDVISLWVSRGIPMEHARIMASLHYVEVASANIKEIIGPAPKPAPKTLLGQGVNS